MSAIYGIGMVLIGMALDQAMSSTLGSAPSWRAALLFGAPGVTLLGLALVRREHGKEPGDKG